MKRPGIVRLLALGCVVATCGLTSACYLLYKKPWSSPEQRKAVMATVATKMLTRAPNTCVQKVLRKLKKPGATQSSTLHRFASQQSSTCQDQNAEGRADSCDRVLRSCGNCHLPRVNNCDYRITWQQGGQSYNLVSRTSKVGWWQLSLKLRGVETVRLKNGQTVRGRVLRMDKRYWHLLKTSGQVRRVPTEQIDSPLLRGGKDNRTRKQNLKAPMTESSPAVTIKLPIAKITKIEWLNGADPLETWWNFKRFSPRGKTALKMFDLVARHKVGCTNCHLGHGDFRFTREGLHFKKTGKVIRRVTLEKFLETR